MALNVFMQEALSVAKRALENTVKEVPVGAVVVQNGIVIASAHNEREHLCDPTAHAEILALRRAAAYLGDWRLSDCDLYVTLEPCPMCLAAIKAARVRRLYCGAYASENPNSNHPAHMEIYYGIDETPCSELLQKFFAAQRQKT